MKLENLFNSDKKELLSIYCTAGFPELESLPKVIDALENSGVDFMEIGMPYSDPLCDGPVIQRSSGIAIKNGMTLSLLFSQLKLVTTTMPLLIMGYFNNVLLYGVEQFCRDCQEAGVSGVILPDLPMEIFESKYAETFNKYGLHFIYLVTPQSSDERIREIDARSTSFIYAISTSGTTGTQGGIRGAAEYLKRLEEMQLDHPVMVGFNISSSEDLYLASGFARGGIVGSAFIKAIDRKGNLENSISEFVDRLRGTPEKIQ